MNDLPFLEYVVNGVIYKVVREGDRAVYLVPRAVVLVRLVPRLLNHRGVQHVVKGLKTVTECRQNNMSPGLQSRCYYYYHYIKVYHNNSGEAEMINIPTNSFYNFRWMIHCQQRNFDMCLWPHTDVIKLPGTSGQSGPHRSDQLFIIDKLDCHGPTMNLHISKETDIIRDIGQWGVFTGMTRATGVSLTETRCLVIVTPGMRLSGLIHFQFFFWWLDITVLYNPLSFRISSI